MQNPRQNQYCKLFCTTFAICFANFWFIENHVCARQQGVHRDLSDHVPPADLSLGRGMNAAVGGMHATPPGARMANERRRELLEKAVAAKRLSLQQSPAAGAAASRPLLLPPPTRAVCAAALCAYPPEHPRLPRVALNDVRRARPLAHAVLAPSPPRPLACRRRRGRRLARRLRPHRAPRPPRTPRLSHTRRPPPPTGTRGHRCGRHRRAAARLQPVGAAAQASSLRRAASRGAPRARLQPRTPDSARALGRLGGAA